MVKKRRKFAPEPYHRLSCNQFIHILVHEANPKSSGGTIRFILEAKCVACL